MIELIINVLTAVINIILIPIDTFIVSALPEFAQILSYISGFLNYILTFVVWAVSWIPLDHVVLSFAFDLLLFYYLWVKFSYPISMFISWLRSFKS